MIDIPVNAHVNCTDGSAGTLMAVIVNPIEQKVTNIVVQDKHSSMFAERLVPENMISSTTADSIQLNCTLEEFSQLRQFNEIHYVSQEEDSLEYLEPFVTSLDTRYTTVDTERVAPAELSVQRGSFVEATDGFIGKVEAFVMQPEDGKITHLLLEKGGKHITLPISSIDYIGEKTVYLKLSNDEVDSLPTIPVQLEWKGKTAVELVVWSYVGADTAQQALEALKELDKEKEIKLLNTAVITKDKNGKTKLHEAEDVDAKHGAFFGAVTGGLIGLLGGPAGVIIGAAAGAAAGGAAGHWIDMGFSNEDLNALKENLQPDHSILVTLLDNISLEKALNALKEWGGERVQQSLTDDQVSKILQKHASEMEVSEKDAS